MHQFDLRVQFIAGLVLLISTTQQVETFLRFILLTLSIIYTLYKIYDRFKEKNKEE